MNPDKFYETKNKFLDAIKGSEFEKDFAKKWNNSDVSKLSKTLFHSIINGQVPPQPHKNHH